MTNIDDILAQLDKKTLQMVKRGSEIEDLRVPFASFGLNFATGGGMGRGKQTTIYGNESAGKSALMLQTIALNQKAGLSCLYIDVEKTFDETWARRLGVNTDELIVSQVSTLQHATDLQIKYIEAGIDMIVIDSRSFLHPPSYYDDKELKGLEGTKQIGQYSKFLGTMCNLVQSVNWNTAVVHLSQVRMDLSGMHASFKQDGGKAAEHADSLRIRVSSTKSDANAVMGEVAYGDMFLQEKVGRKVGWRVEKNKLNGKDDVGEYNLHTQGDFVGVDKASEIFAYGVKFGIIEKAGAWVTVNGERFQGGTKAMAYLRDNPEIAEKIENEIVEKAI